MHFATIADFPSWRVQARQWLALGIPPDDVTWSDPRDVAVPLPLHGSADSQIDVAGRSRNFTLPRELLRALELCACHRDPRKWPLMYKLVWRASHGERHVLQLTADDDVRALHAMVRSVEQDSHKMKAFVRFRETRDQVGVSRFVAWFQPRHLILERVAPFFADRFASMHWTIVTPDGAAQWNGAQLRYLKDAESIDVPSHDDKETLWRAYYASIFNPARLNERVLRQHMPVHYWRNLPEVQDIPRLAHDSRRRVADMIGAPAQDVDRWGYAAPSGQENLLNQNTAPLAERISQCRRCVLWERATQAVCGAGPQHAAIMLVGEQPGDEEDLKGQPFVGPAGRLLDRALLAADIPREQVYITNAVKHFKWEPRGKRRMHKTPAQAEIAACMDWLEQEIAAVKPSVVVALGATALQTLLGRKETLTRARDMQLSHRSGARIIATYHPAAILRADHDAQDTLYEVLCEDLARARSVIGDQ